MKERGKHIGKREVGSCSFSSGGFSFIESLSYSGGLQTGKAQKSILCLSLEDLEGCVTELDFLIAFVKDHQWN